MSQSLSKIYLHLIFSTKDRIPYLTDRGLRREVHAYLAGACRDLGSPSIAVGGVEDHVHMLFYMSRTSPVSDLVAELKRESSKWIKSKDSSLASFYWQKGYGVFSISPAHVEALTSYIANQESHHRNESFQDEYRRLLRKYDVEFDERYVWN